MLLPSKVDPIEAFQAAFIRRVQTADLKTIAQHGTRKDLAETVRAYRQYGFWGPDNGAVSIVETQTKRLVGTAQYFRPGPTIHGFELAYAIYDIADRNRGFLSTSLRQFSDLLFDEYPGERRHQLVIAASNVASCVVAERSGFSREACLSGAAVEDGGDIYLYGRQQNEKIAQSIIDLEPCFGSARAARALAPFGGPPVSIA